MLEEDEIDSSWLFKYRAGTLDINTLAPNTPSPSPFGSKADLAVLDLIHGTCLPVRRHSTLKLSMV
jgi:hypothetical protein